MMRVLVILSLAASSAVHSQTAPEPNDVLARAKARIIETMRRLPKYTCVETIDRGYYAPVRPSNAPVPSCAEANAEKTKGLPPMRLSATDRLRLEVAESDEHEIYSWPGASHFETGHVDEMIERGPIASGAFGGYVVDIFATDGAKFQFLGERAENNRRVFSYSYSIAQELSRYRVRTDDGWAVTAYFGTFDIDPASLELLRIVVNTPELPPATTLCHANSALEVARVRIGDGDFLLPSVSRLHLVNRTSAETESTAVFSGCKEYRAESVLHIEGDDAPSSSTASVGDAVRNTLPEGVRLALRLNSAIDSDFAAAGDAVTAILTEPARDPRSRAVLFPAGAVAHGRINRMEHFIAGAPRFVIGIQWESIESAGASSQFAAIVDHSADMLAAAEHRIGSGLLRRPPPVGPPDALTFATENERYVIPAKYETQWVTVTPTPPKK
jgi:hypothetical protein